VETIAASPVRRHAAGLVANWIKVPDGTALTRASPRSLLRRLYAQGLLRQASRNWNTISF
jgi:hypothetical protein